MSDLSIHITFSRSNLSKNHTKLSKIYNNLITIILVFMTIKKINLRLFQNQLIRLFLFLLIFQLCTINILNYHYWTIRCGKKYPSQRWITAYAWKVQIIDIKLEVISHGSNQAWFTSTRRAVKQIPSLPCLANLSRSSLSILFCFGSIADFSNVVGCSRIIKLHSRPGVPLIKSRL